MMAKSGLTPYQQRQLAKAASCALGPVSQGALHRDEEGCPRSLAVPFLAAGSALPTDVGPTSKKTEPRPEPSRSKAAPTIQVRPWLRRESLCGALAKR